MSIPLIIARIVFAGLLAAVTYLSLNPEPNAAATGFDLAEAIAARLFGRPELGDKVAHFSAYAALASAAVAARPRMVGAYLLTSGALVLYGAGLEGLQGLIASRQPDFLDGVANLLGVVAGGACALILEAAIAPRSRRARAA